MNQPKVQRLMEKSAQVVGFVIVVPIFAIGAACVDLVCLPYNLYKLGKRFKVELAKARRE